jgi:8-oxo-dGTP pyrophosphatase MutT (NUDIX family)
MPATPRLAATVLLVREAEPGPEIFMVRRHQRSGFMANATVFVGGRLDQADSDPAVLARSRGLTAKQAAARLGLDRPELALALHVAAVRETFEESGVLLVDGAPLDADLAGQLRQGLNQDTLGFAALLERVERGLALDRLHYLSHWITPEVEPRRYDTYFFVCKVPEGQQASYDQRETTAGTWATVEALLAGNQAREVLLAPPTLCTLEDLRAARSADEIVAAAVDRPVAPVMPRPLVERTAELTLLLPGDHRYDDPTSAAGPEHYVVLRDGHWQRVRRDLPAHELPG